MIFSVPLKKMETHAAALVPLLESATRARTDAKPIREKLMKAMQDAGVTSVSAGHAKVVMKQSRTRKSVSAAKLLGLVRDTMGDEVHAKCKRAYEEARGDWVMKKTLKVEK